MSLPHRTYPKSVRPGIPRLGPLKSGWRRVQIGELFREHSRPVQMQDAAPYELVTVKRSRGGIEKRSTLYGQQIGVKSQFELRADDFLISKRQIVHGACAIVTSDFEGSIVSNEYSVLRCTDALDLKFLSYLTHTPYFQRTCFHSSIGVHVEKMIFKLSDWFKWSIDVPSLPEQKKIADFLGAVDGKLLALREKEAALTRFKRGLMQALFSQAIRFTRDDGSNYPDWKEKRLGDLGRFLGGGTPDTELDRYWMGNIPWVSSSDVLDADLTGPKITRWITPEAMSDSATKLVPAGSILIVTRVGVGKLTIATNDLCTSQDFTNFIPSGVNAHFVGYYLLNEPKKLLRLCQGTSIKGLTTEDLKNLRLEVPHLIEQQKIADALSAIDAKIAAVGDQTAQLSAFKKGLLQKMFV